MKRFVWVFSIMLLVGLSLPQANAQCAMCKATIENSTGEQATIQQRAKGLNNGILYLMCIPYILGGIIAYYWYKNSKKERDRKDKVQSILRSKMSKV